MIKKTFSGIGRTIVSVQRGLTSALHAIATATQMYPDGVRPARGRNFFSRKMRGAPTMMAG